MNRFDCIYNRARTTIPPRPNAPQMICSRVAPLMVQFATPSLRAAARSPFPLSLSFSRKLPASLFSRDKVVTIPELGCKLSRNVYTYTHVCTQALEIPGCSPRFGRSQWFNLHEPRHLASPPPVVFFLEEEHASSLGPSSLGRPRPREISPVDDPITPPPFSIPLIRNWSASS